MDETDLSGAEIMHEVCEDNLTRLDDFKSPLEAMITLGNKIVRGINNPRTSAPEDTRRFTEIGEHLGFLKIGKIDYEVYKDGNEFYVVSCCDKPVNMGRTEQEFRANLGKLKGSIFNGELE